MFRRFVQQVWRNGSSIVVTLPRPILHALKLDVRDCVEIRMYADSLVIRKVEYVPSGNLPPGFGDAVSDPVEVAKS